MINYKKFERDHKLSKAFDYDLFDNDTYRLHSNVIKYLLEMSTNGYVIKWGDNTIYDYVYDDKVLFNYYIYSGKEDL